VTANEQKIEDELEALVNKVRVEQEELKSLGEEISRPAKSIQEPEDFAAPVLDQRRELLPEQKSSGQVFLDGVFGDRAIDKVRVSVAFTAGMASYYFFSLLFPVVAAGTAGYCVYRYYDWKRQGPEEAQETIIDVDPSKP
jgi:hypothetical protein